MNTDKKNPSLWVSVLMMLVTLSYQNVQAQVTIGSNNPAAKASLLQIKDTEPDNPESDNQTSMHGGLILPRVKLSSIESLEPLLSGYDTMSEIEKQKEAALHKGLMVFNVNALDDKIFIGIYIWYGNEWKAMTDNDVL